MKPYCTKDSREVCENASLMISGSVHGHGSEKLLTHILLGVQSAPEGHQHYSNRLISIEKSHTVKNYIDLAKLDTRCNSITEF